MAASWDTVEAALLGGAWALPLLACSAAAHTPEAEERLPLLGGLHAAQKQLLRPLLKGESTPPPPFA